MAVKYDTHIYDGPPSERNMSHMTSMGGIEAAPRTIVNRVSELSGTNSELLKLMTVLQDRVDEAARALDVLANRVSPVSTRRFGSVVQASMSDAKGDDPGYESSNLVGRNIEATTRGVVELIGEIELITKNLEV